MINGASNWKPCVLVALLLLGSTSAQTSEPRHTNYDEHYARMMYFMSAGAYSPEPGKCVNETARLSNQVLELYTQGTNVCDTNENFCAFYITVSPTTQSIIITFRGTRGRKQLFHEVLQSLKPNVHFFGTGKVNRYFFRALNSMWDQVTAVLTDPRYTNYTISFTGHSLGGALASLAAMRTVLDQLRQSNQVKLYTFGQPRVGNYKFAIEHDRLVPESYRIINRNDIVPHLPFCHIHDNKQSADDESIANQNTQTDTSSLGSTTEIRKPCNMNESKKAYHHGTEIWYPQGMFGDNPTYRECLGTPLNEDRSCSNGVKLDASYFTIQRYVHDHTHYFGEKVSVFGKAGCRVTPNIQTIPPPTQTSGFGSASTSDKDESVSGVKRFFWSVLDKINKIKNGQS